jgi:hypothetical protein
LKNEARRTGKALLARLPFQGSEEPVQETGALTTNGHGLIRMKSPNRKKSVKDFATPVGCALQRAAKVVRKIARMHGTPIYIWRNGKVVAEKP